MDVEALNNAESEDGDEADDSEFLEENIDENDAEDEPPPADEIASPDAHRVLPDEPDSWSSDITLADQVKYGWIAHQNARAGSDLARHCRRLSARHPQYQFGN